MLKMVEVVGTSPKGYSEAVKAAVDALVAAGEKVHFFTVTEQRGSHHAGRIEFQVVVKAAVDGG